MGKKTRAQRNAIRKQGWKEYKQGWKTGAKGAGQGLVGAAQGAVEGVTSGRDLASKVAGAVAQAGIKGAQAGSGNVIKGAAQRIKGLAKMIFNDLSWYENYPELIKGMAGANFSTDDSREILYNAGGSARESKNLVVTHCVTLTNGSSDAIRHMAIQKIWESTRRANSGATNTTTEDYNNYYIIVRNIVGLASELRRAFGFTNKYTAANLAVPNLYLQAAGFDAQDFINNAANIRTYLNQLNQRLEVYVPLNLPVIKRTEWMFSNLFMDSDDYKAQPHMFQLGSYLHYDVANTRWVVRNKPVNTLLTSAQLIAMIEDEISALVNVTPAGIIAGDMLKAFGASELYHFGYTDENYTTPYGYSEEVLTQIQNAVAIHPSTVQAARDANNFIYLQAFLSAVPGHTTGSALPYVFMRDMNEPQINFYKNQISNTEIIGASRFIVCAQQTVTAGSTNILFHYGTEYIDMSFAYHLSGGTVVSVNMITYYEAAFANVPSALQYSKMWSHVDWMPRFNLEITYYNASGSQLYTSVTDVWDYNNAGFLSIMSTSTLHEIAYASLYYVPLLSKESNNLVKVGD